MHYLIAVDGPSASGKTTVCSLLAKKLKINHLSSGALYRAIALYLIQYNIDINNHFEDALKEIKIKVKFEDFKQFIILNNIDVTNLLQTEEISRLSAIISQKAIVREFVKKIQVSLAKSQSIIIDGRDITSVILPNAKYKFYVTASVEARSERRYLQHNKKIPLEEIKKDIILRDKQDTERELCPLKIVEDAIVVDTSNLTIDQTVEFMYNVIIRK